MVRYRKIAPAAAANQIAQKARIPPAHKWQQITCLYLKEVKRITSQIPGPYLYFLLWRRCLNVASMINLSFMCQANFIIFNLDSFVFWGRSTASQLLQVSNEIGKSLDQIIQTDILYLDFSKAFDKVDQGFWKPLKLVSKLPYRSSSESHHLRQDIAISPPPPPPPCYQMFPRVRSLVLCCLLCTWTTYLNIPRHRLQHC